VAAPRRLIGLNDVLNALVRRFEDFRANFFIVMPPLYAEPVPVP
jgi:hypothetical protein